jgi:hypothetical protein
VDGTAATPMTAASAMVKKAAPPGGSFDDAGQA